MAADTEHRQDAESAGAGYEVRDTNSRAIAKVGIGLVILTLGSLVFTWYFMKGLHYFSGIVDKPAPVPAVARNAPAALPPSPRLQVNPAADMAEWRKHEESLLTTYGWVNETSGVVRVPVDVAMEMVLEKGLPSAAVETSATAPMMTGRQELWDSSGGQAGRL